jgi:hypothetical protein
MQQRKFLKKSKKKLGLFSGLLLSSFILTGCFSWTEEKVVVQTKIIKPNIPTQAKPKPVQMNKVKFYVVTKKNLNEFMAKFEKETGDVVFYAISVRDYEDLALNLADLRRYLQQQDKIIVYYEKAIKDIPEEKIPQR